VTQQSRPPDQGAAPAGTDAAPVVPPRRRRPYRTPRVTEYGSVAKMTQGSLTVQNDFFMSGMRMMCL
jgi:hypothetical protein